MWVPGVSKKPVGGLLMCSDAVMKAQELRKVYHLYPNPMSRLKQLIGGDRYQCYEEFIALKSVSFELKRGEVLGVVGRNGAGKSTLLQLLCGTLTPTSGNLEVNGRIAALLELGAGFNPEFSGRENIYLSGSVMGLSRAEIDSLLDEIIDFSGIRPFIDQPVKTYSSGMYVRLAFSVATSVDPDILVIDEALSVGDGDFARRSFDRIMAMRDRGKTILFCSHALYQVEALCSRAIWLEAGEVVESGSPDVVVTNYQSFLDRMSVAENAGPSAHEDGNSGDGVAETSEDDADSASAESVPVAHNTRIISTSVSADGNIGKTLTVKSGITSLAVAVDFVRHKADEVPGVAVLIRAASGQLVTSCGSWNDGFYPEIGSDGRGSVSVVFDDIPLLKGRYHVAVVLFCQQGMYVYDEASPIATLEVSQKGLERGLVAIPRQWSGVTETLVDDRAYKAEPEPIEKSEPAPVEPAVWRSEDAGSTDESVLLKLFSQAFGFELSPVLWRWKYRFTPNPGKVVYRGERAVGFIGGMPRKVAVFGKDENAVQVGDVMVAPDVRGVLSRHGAFYRAMHPFLVDRVGAGKEYPYAFGFPTERSMRLGVKHGLYTEVDKIVQGRWAAETGRTWRLSARALSDDDLPLVDGLWEKMKQDGDDVAICCRDSSWIQHRYLDKPEGHYQLMMVCERLTRKAVGLVVLKDHGDDGVELIDIVAPKSSFSDVIGVARVMTGRLGREWLFGWFTPSAMIWCEGTEPVIEETAVVVPGSAVNNVEHALHLKGCWWLMGGDTDFR